MHSRVYPPVDSHNYLEITLHYPYQDFQNGELTKIDGQHLISSCEKLRLPNRYSFNNTLDFNLAC